MKRSPLAWTALVWFAPLTPAFAADLNKIDRRLAKEPAYQSRPQYCLLVFGPEAATRVWLVLDGESLYVDRNGNGDLTEPGERVRGRKEGNVWRFSTGAVGEGRLTHTDLEVYRIRPTPEMVAAYETLKRMVRKDPEACYYQVSIKVERGPQAGGKPPAPTRILQTAMGDAGGYLVFGPDPRTAPLVHFNGPWAMGMTKSFDKPLHPGQPGQDLMAGVGTPGVGPGTFAQLAYDGVVPAAVHPVAEIAWPTRDPAGPPLRTRLVLADRC